MGVYDDASYFYELNKPTSFFPRPVSSQQSIDPESEDEEERQVNNKSKIFFKFEDIDLRQKCSNDFHGSLNLLSEKILDEFENYDAFLILIKNDLIPDIASYLSFMFKSLTKPIVLTDAQVSVNNLRTDVVLNFSGAIIIAANVEVPEVCVFYDGQLYRGNRVMLKSADDFQRFESPNLLPLVTMGIHVKPNYDVILPVPVNRSLELVPSRKCEVTVLSLYPNITIETVKSLIPKDIDGIVLLTYGAGNGPNERRDIMAVLKTKVGDGVLILNCTQCKRGRCTLASATGLELKKCGIINTSDMTVEACCAKLNYVLSLDISTEQRRKLLGKNLRGEMTK